MIEYTDNIDMGVDQIQRYSWKNTSVFVNLYTFTYIKVWRLQKKHTLICNQPESLYTIETIIIWIFPNSAQNH